MAKKPPDIRRELAVAALGEHHQKFIREGMPEVGWDGDPWLTLAYNKLQDRLEIWVEDPGREPICVMRSKPLSKGAPSIQELCIHLANHDLRKISMDQIQKRIDDHNLANEKRIHDAYIDKQREAYEKVAWSVGRAVGEYRPVIGMHGVKSTGASKT